MRAGEGDFKLMARPLNIRRRLRAIQGTRKVTHAMELVAATKMRRAVAAVGATRRYAALAWEFLAEVRQRQEVAGHPLLVGRAPVERSLLLVVAGNRGLVGAFNQRVAGLALRTFFAEGVPTEVVTAGRVAARLLHRSGVEVAADFPKKDLLASPEDAAPLAAYLLTAFERGAVDRVRMVYADFVSSLRQEPRVRTLLPVGDPDPFLGHFSPPASALSPPSRLTPPSRIFEPSAEAVLRAVVPNLLAVQITQALLETTAAEHAARMVAMRNATEAAGDLAAELVRELQKERQQRITRELQEIVSGSLVGRS